ncbi:MAG: Lrp/AsnC family transcriptional regulator, partial [Candidatus Micrarchaeaceae archaeon]
EQMHKSEEIKATGEDYADMLMVRFALNSRMPASELAKEFGISEEKVNERIEEYKRKYGMVYTIDINMERISFVNLILFGKFRGKKPTVDEIGKEIEKINDPRVQFAAAVTGPYDIIIFYTVENTYVEEDYSWSLHRYAYLIRKKIFPNLKAKWRFSIVSNDYGLQPLKSEWFDALDGISWKKGKGTAKPQIGQIPYKKCLVLRELFENTTEDFAEMDKKFGFKKETAARLANEMVKDSIILSYTINLTGIHPNSMAIVLIEEKGCDHGAYDGIISKFARGKIGWPIDKCSYIGTTYSPTGKILFIPILQKGEVEQAKQNFSGIEGAIVHIMNTKKIFIDYSRYKKSDMDHIFTP